MPKIPLRSNEMTLSEMNSPMNGKSVKSHQNGTIPTNVSAVSAASSAMVTNRLLKIPEVAKILGCSDSKAYKLAQSGVLPVRRIGRSLRVPEKALQRWIEDGTTSGQIA